MELRSARIDGVHVEGSEIRDLRLERTSVYGGTGGLVDYCDWSDTRFYEGGFSDCSFESGEFDDCRFERATLKGVKFRGCDFRDVEMSDCDIDGLEIDGVDVKDAIEEYRKHR